MAGGLVELDLITKRGRGFNQFDTVLKKDRIRHHFLKIKTDTLNPPLSIQATRLYQIHQLQCSRYPTLIYPYR